MISFDYQLHRVRAISLGFRVKSYDFSVGDILKHKLKMQGLPFRQNHVEAVIPVTVSGEDQSRLRGKEYCILKLLNGVLFLAEGEAGAMTRQFGLADEAADTTSLPAKVA